MLRLHVKVDLVESEVYDLRQDYILVLFLIWWVIVVFVWKLFSSNVDWHVSVDHRGIDIHFFDVFLSKNEVSMIISLFMLKLVWDSTGCHSPNSLTHEESFRIPKPSIVNGNTYPYSVLCQ